MSVTEAGPIDPLAPLATAGRYEDELVVVQRWSGAWPRRARGSVRTEHFDVAPYGGRLLVTHRVPRERIDDDLTGVVARELFGPGWVRGSEMFERIFTGIVRSSAADGLDSWELFYRNTIRRLGRLADLAQPCDQADPPQPAHGSLEGYAPVYDRAVGLVLGPSVLEVGSCFGFLALRLAALGYDVTASDVSAGTMRLLTAVAPRLDVRLQTLLADAARLPVADLSADTVLVVHLLEHLEADQGDLVVAEAVRCARRRVVVAVPLEEVADESYGHVRTVTLADLHRWGAGTGLPFTVGEHCGGWLVVDVP